MPILDIDVELLPEDWQEISRQAVTLSGNEVIALIYDYALRKRAQLRANPAYAFLQTHD